MLKKVVNLSRKISNSTVRESAPERASAVRENRTPDGLKKPDFRPLHPTFAPGEQGQKVLRFRLEAPVLGHFGYSEGPEIPPNTLFPGFRVRQICSENVLFRGKNGEFGSIRSQFRQAELLEHPQPALTVESPSDRWKSTSFLPQSSRNCAKFMRKKTPQNGAFSPGFCKI